MPVSDISLTTLVEKNKSTQSLPWVTLLEVQIKDSDEVLRLVRDVESQEWGGETWLAFPFEFGEVKEDSKEYPEVELTINNSNLAFQSYIEDNEGCIGSTIIMRIVYAGNLTIENTKAEIEEIFCVNATSSNATEIKFTLGANQPNNLRFPLNRYLKNHCRFVFKSTKCGYTGDETSCDKTRTTCDKYGNIARFGGFPTIPVGGTYY